MALIRRAAWPIVVTGVLVAMVIVTLLTSGQGDDQPLDPDGVGPNGARALAQVLRAHGVHVQVERTADDLGTALDEQPSAVVLVTRTDLLSDVETTALRQGVVDADRTLVLVTPSSDQLQELAPRAQLDSGLDRTTASPQCSVAAAARAGVADAGGATYQVDGSGSGGSGASDSSCYPVDGHASYVVLGGDHPAVLIGQPSLLTNDRLAHQGNAALAIGTLGSTGQLIWFVPSGAGVVAESGQRSLSSVLPSWVPWVTLELLLVAGVCMLWRGRRLGRLVPEPLPVVVRGVETTEGRARMYRRARARDRAAGTLREAALSRLRTRTGLPRSARPDEVVAVVAAQTGRPAQEVASVVTGPLPLDDAELLRLARLLDDLDREVLRP